MISLGLAEGLHFVCWGQLNPGLIVVTWLDCGMLGCLAQSGASLTANQEVAGSIPSPATYFCHDLS